MFEQSQLPQDGLSYIGTRILVVGGAGLLLSFGLCGVGAFSGGVSGSASQTFAMLGAGLFLLSIAALVVGAITLVVELIARR